MSYTPKEKPQIAICMATYNPPTDLFKKQIKSIINQDYTNWICIINDDCSNRKCFKEIKEITSKDSRFLVYRNISNVGFYYNFEQCLQKVPENIEFIAFADQDDLWYEDKLSTCLSNFDEETTLVYSDMRIVDIDDEKVISNTYWINRDNNYDKLDLLLFANTITGAASLFRRNLLEIILPFPERVGDTYHDWWVACVALCMGKIKYVDKPLYDYHQHRKNVLGHFTQKQSGLLSSITSNGLQSYVWEKYNMFLNDFVRIVLISNSLKNRCLDITPEKKKILNEISNYENSTSKLFFRAIKSKFRRKNITLDAESRLWQSRVVSNMYKNSIKLKRNRNTKIAGILTSSEDDVNDRIVSITKKIAPLNLEIVSDQDSRINIIIPTIDFTYFFGGYIAKFNLAKHLSKQGNDVRLIIVDWCDFNPVHWKEEIKKYHGLEDFFDIVEVEYAFDRTKPIQISKQDVFVATTWWTAHIANDVIRSTDSSRFVYLIQEFEPFTFSHGTYYALSQETYDFPHYAIFSTQFLSDFFKEKKIGVYKKSLEEGDENSVYFKNPILEFDLKEDEFFVFIK